MMEIAVSNVLPFLKENWPNAHHIFVCEFVESENYKASTNDITVDFVYFVCKELEIDDAIASLVFNEPYSEIENNAIIFALKEKEDLLNLIDL